MNNDEIRNAVKYYLNAAEETGRMEDGKAAGYSLEDIFNELNADNLPPLLNAFFRGEKQPSDKMPDENEIKKCLSGITVPYDAQMCAIANALTERISLVQGPPGTGKTEMIIDLLCVLHGLYPQKTVAVVSSNKEALDNINDKIDEGKAKSKNLSAVNNCFARLGNTSVRKYWKNALDKQGLDSTHISNKISHKIDPDSLKEYPMFSSTIHSLRKIYTTNESFVNQFDYVIVDECSQIGIMLGLVTLMSAKHLVLIGDNFQIPPIISNKFSEINKLYNNFPDIYKEDDKGEKSFLTICEEVFGGTLKSVFLNRHYRCHSSIIDFCNEYVYSGRLEVMNRRDDEFRMRALWYEGDYCEIVTEKVGKNNNIKKNKINMRQIKIFMREEWPQLCRRLKENSNLSACIISPFAKQLLISKTSYKHF